MINRTRTRPVWGRLTTLAVAGMLAACGGGTRIGTKVSAGDASSPAHSSVAGSRMAGDMSAVWLGRMRAPPVAPVAARNTGFCPAIDSVLVDEGRDVFDRTGGCYACHGHDARGSGVGPGLTGSVWLDIDGSYPAIAEVVREGIVRPSRFPGAMPAMGGAQLKAEQVCAVAAYVYSLSH